MSPFSLPLTSISFLSNLLSSMASSCHLLFFLSSITLVLPFSNSIPPSLFPKTIGGDCAVHRERERNTESRKGIKPIPPPLHMSQHWISPSSSSHALSYRHVSEHAVPFFVCFSFFAFFRVAPVAYGSFQAMGWTGATAASLCYSHRNTRSECVCDLHCSSRQCWIFNPLREASDWTQILRICNLLSYKKKSMLFLLYFSLLYLTKLRWCFRSESHFLQGPWSWAVIYMWSCSLCLQCSMLPRPKCWHH